MIHVFTGSTKLLIILFNNLKKDNLAYLKATLGVFPKTGPIHQELIIVLVKKGLNKFKSTNEIRV